MEPVVEARKTGEDIFYIDLEKDFLDRFSMAKFLENDNGFDLAVNSYFLFKFKQLKTVGYYKVNFEINRADTLSYNIFNGNEDLWWLLCYYNGLTWYELTHNMLIKIFSISDLEKLILDISQKQLFRN